MWRRHNEEVSDSSSHPAEHAFLEGEGDAWFWRNKHLLTSKTIEEEAWIPLLFALIPRAVRAEGTFLEVGSSWGAKTAAISRLLGMPGIGVDPSREATRLGQELFADQVTLRRGIASRLPVPSQSVTVIFYGFCLYLVAPERMNKVMGELQRVTSRNHFVAITDFDYPYGPRVPYAHADGVYSYRHCYESLMREQGYQLVAKLPLENEEIGVAPSRMDRVSAWLFEQNVGESTHLPS